MLTQELSSFSESTRTTWTNRPLPPCRWTEPPEPVMFVNQIWNYCFWPILCFCCHEEMIFFLTFKNFSGTVSTHTFQVQFQRTHFRYSFNTHISGAVSTHTFQVQFPHTHTHTHFRYSFNTHISFHVKFFHFSKKTI